MLGFQRLDVYRCAVRFLGLASSLTGRVPRGQADLVEQFRRAALSILLNIAEGSGKDGRDAVRFYAIARGSAMECAAVLDAMESLGLVDGAALGEERELLERIVSMLTKMRPRSRDGGSGGTA
jgi:four helix bundle protein